MEQPKTFEFFAPMSSFVKGKEHDGKNVIDVLVGGVISDESIDEDGEKLLQDGIDFEYFKSHGVIKYEHSKGGAAIIGHPLEVRRNGKRTEFVGHILAKSGTPQFKVAEEVLGLMENATLWNQVHPDNPKPVGYSLEGAYGKIVPNGTHKDVQKSKVTNVVFTPNPKNKNTFAVMFKSFMAGEGVNIGDLTGGQAGRVQNLEGSAKKLKLIGVPKMKFTNKEECKKFYIAKGFSEDEAEKKWTEYEAMKKSRDDVDTMHKSKIDSISTSIEAANTMLKSFDSNSVLIEMTGSFNKSMEPDANKQIDAMPFLKAIGENTIAMHKSMTEQNKKNAEILVGVLTSLKDSMEMNKSLTEEVRNLEDQNTDLIEFNTELMKTLAKMDKSFTKEPGAGGAAADDKNKGEEGDDDKNKQPKYAPQEVATAMNKALKNCKEEDTDNSKNLLNMIALAENRGFNYNLFDKSMQAEVDAMMK